MGNIGENADASPLKVEKKSKKNKNKTNNTLVDVDDGNVHVEINGDIPKEKDHKHKEKKKKKKKSEANEDQHDTINLEDNADLLKKDKKKKKKKKKKSESNEDQHDTINLEDNGNLPKKDKKKKKKKKSESNEDQHDTVNLEDNGDLLKKDKKKKKSESNEDQHDKVNSEDNGDTLKKDKKKKKRKRESSENSQIKENEQSQDDESAVEKVHDSSPTKPKKKKTKHNEKQVNNEVTEKVKVKGKNKSTKEKPKSKVKPKKVSFSGQVEVFPTSETEPEPQTTTENDGLVRGKRFTPEEDKIVVEAVHNYITARNLGDEGLKMVLNCNSHPGMKKCWQEIGTCIPYRPYTAVYYRAHILFERGENRSWTPDEIEFLKKSYEKHGNNWKMIAEELGKSRVHVKDTWRRIKLKDLKSGKWSQEEYQALYDMVNLDLQMKVSGNHMKKSKHGMLRDNIPWTAISEKLASRSDSTCCTKWYDQLTSSLVKEKKWSDADDYRLIGALYELDATCVDDVDWDNVLEHRDGDVCKKRWTQMVRLIGDHGSKPFAEQVDILATRYCPEMAETREEWDKKPVVP